MTTLMATFRLTQTTVLGKDMVLEEAYHFSKIMNL
jgi:hypothetical protein